MSASATSPLPSPRPPVSPSIKELNGYRSSIARPSSRSSMNGALSPPPTSFSPVSSPQVAPFSPTPTKSSRRRSSYETIATLAASNGNVPASSIPLPINIGSLSLQETIPEGIPIEITSARSSSPLFNRPSTPTRTISRIPVASVGHSRFLADDGGHRSRSVSPLPKPAFSPGDTSFESSDEPSISLPPVPAPAPPSSSTNPYRRSLIAAGGTTKVLAELQAAAISARSSLENTKSQLRQSQRTVAQLTRQTEDLKDGRERLRLENESLNNVVARKERLLQEVLERARKAEAEVIALKVTLKTEQQTAKKSAATYSEAITISQKSQREYSTLKDSIQSMAQGWKDEIKELKEAMRKQDEGWRKETEEIGLKYRSLVKLVQASKSERARLDSLKTEATSVDKNFEEYLRNEIKTLHAEIERSSRESEESDRTAKTIAQDLARLRSLMRTAGSVKIPVEDSP